MTDPAVGISEQRQRALNALDLERLERDGIDALEAERDRLREAVRTVLPWLEFRARSTDRSGDEFRSASDLLGAALSVGETADQQLQTRRATMTGSEHYAEAERLLKLLEIGGNDPRDPLIATAASVHATLALASVQSAFYYGETRAFGSPPIEPDPWARAVPPLSTETRP